MRKKILAGLIPTIILAAFMVVLAGGDDHPIKATSSLPESLGSFYPPSAKGPVYLFTMLELAPPFSGIMSDLMEGELDNVQANYNSFRQKYLAAAEMVPEWKDEFGLTAVEELGKAVESKDQSKIIPAFEAVGKACVDCHVKYSTPVQQKHHWGDFSQITLTDPISNTDVSYMRFMLMIESDYSGIGIDLSQGQIENAKAHVDGFEKRYAALKESCDGCHDSERKYYVDDSVFGMIGGLKSKLAAQILDQKGIGELIQGIGMESCFKCHLVHTPAAYAQARSR